GREPDRVRDVVDIPVRPPPSRELRGYHHALAVAGALDRRGERRRWRAGSPDLRKPQDRRRRDRALDENLFVVEEHALRRRHDPAVRIELLAQRRIFIERAWLDAIPRLAAAQLVVDTVDIAARRHD